MLKNTLCFYDVEQSRLQDVDEGPEMKSTAAADQPRSLRLLVHHLLRWVLRGPLRRPRDGDRLGQLARRALGCARSAAASRTTACSEPAGSRPEVRIISGGGRLPARSRALSMLWMRA